MISRRTFLRNSGALALGSVLATDVVANATALLAKARPAGIQLYTVMASMEENADATLKRIAAIGYKELESAFSRKLGGYYGLKPKEFADKAKEHGLTWRSHHIGGARRKPTVGTTNNAPAVINLRDNYQQAVDEAAEGGLKYLVCAGTPLETAEDLKLAVDTFTKTGEACKKAGLTFAYHNHTKEFEKVDDKIPFELFFSEISPDLMKWELDLAWAVKAGADPVALFKKYPGRFPLWHVKDITTEQKPVEVGAGIIDFKPIFAAAKTSGMEYFFVEQDAAPSPLENVATSFANLKKTGVI
ncbi:MAG: xylose isomerase [Azospira oryzae]|jgi:sugar phosphate isomerase/epimerase|nr:MAG: xylose isomerase [Azospira oryzae]